MQNLNAKETIETIKKTKPEIKKELQERKKNENTDILEKVNNCITNEDAAKLV